MTREVTNIAVLEEEDIDAAHTVVVKAVPADRMIKSTTAGVGEGPGRDRDRTVTAVEGALLIARRGATENVTGTEEIATTTIGSRPGTIILTGAAAVALRTQTIGGTLATATRVMRRTVPTPQRRQSRWWRLSTGPTLQEVAPVK